MEVLFKGLLNTANDAVKFKIHDGNRNTMNRYFDLFEEHIAPRPNTPIAVMELKRLFQGFMSLEDFHTKALHLVKEAEYPEGDTQNRILRDTLISGIASDQICAKIIKEGKDVTLARVMEIARLEVSTQRHIDRMQETAKVNYVQYEKGSKTKKSKYGKFQQSTVNGSSSGSTGNPSKSGGKDMKVPLPTDICWRCGKGRHQKGQLCKALEAVYRNSSIKGHFEKVCMNENVPHI